MALTEKLFDSVPFDHMPEAEQAVRQGAAKLPDEVQARFGTTAKLSDADRAAIVEIARTALNSFEPEAVPEAEADISAQTRSAGKESS
jgi:F-type H+-transporting ATPase subunit alpha